MTVQIKPRLAAEITHCDLCRITGMQAIMAHGVDSRICFEHGMVAWMQAGGTTD